MPIDIIILHMYTISENHMMYGFGDMEHDRIFSHFGPFYFAIFPKKSKF